MFVCVGLYQTNLLIVYILFFLFSGFPFFVSGRSAPTGQFFPSHVSLGSHEDTSAWMFSYNFVKNVAGKIPKYRMGDGAKEITKTPRAMDATTTRYTQPYTTPSSP